MSKISLTNILKKTFKKQPPKKKTKKEIKNLEEMDKIKIVKSLWKIIYSNKDADIYETNLMRSLAGLLYVDSTVMGNIKEEIKKEYL